MVGNGRNEEGVVPVAFTTALFLDLLGVSVDVAVLCEIARKVLDVVGSAVSETGVVTIVLFMGAGH